MASAPERSSRTTFPVSLGLWLLACCLLFAIAPAPAMPGPRPGDSETFARVVADQQDRARRWHEREGDLRIPWDQARGHLAFVFDDIGHELHVHHKLQALRAPLTFSVLPGASYATGAQLRLLEDRRRERTIMLHLPCEPRDSEHMFNTPGERAQDFLLASDTPEQLRNKLLTALDRVPTAVGVNNHMGSRLTANRAAMDALMPILRERGMFFVDSLTIGQSVAAAAARAAQVPTLERHVFLDNDPRPDAIAKQLERAAARALEQPTIAIAHPSLAVARSLRDALPELHARGIGIFSMREFVERETRWRAPTNRGSRAPSQ